MNFEIGQIVTATDSLGGTATLKIVRIDPDGLVLETTDGIFVWRRFEQIIR